MPDRSVRTRTSPGPGSGSATGRISPRPGSHNQNASASCCTGLTPRVPPGRDEQNVPVERVTAVSMLHPPMLDARTGGSVRRLPTGLAVGLIAQIALLASLAGSVGLGAAGWAVGLAYAAIGGAALAVLASRSGNERLGPANAVTLGRATLVGGVAALVADSLTEPTSVPTLVALTVVALALDTVDGWVARRTRTASQLGWRFDQEVDSFLILVLSVYVAFSIAWWVLAIGLARYAFALAGGLWPWMAGTLPPRYWGKVVAAVQGIVLTIAAADVLPRPWTYAVLVVSAV